MVSAPAAAYAGPTGGDVVILNFRLFTRKSQGGAYNKSETEVIDDA